MIGQVPTNPSREERKPWARPKALELSMIAAASLLFLGLKMYSNHYARGLPFAHSACNAPIADATPPFYSSIYPAILNWTRNETSEQVTEIVIPADLVEIQQNVCRGRAYLADLLQVLDQNRPSVIVVDKYFSPDSCITNPASTSQLMDVVRGLKTPLVVGESTDTATKEEDESCLVQKKQLNLGSKVLHGVTRLNVNKEEIPLEWNVLPKQPVDDDIRSQQTQSLALVAARAAAPEAIRAHGFLAVRNAERQPYARFREDIPKGTSTEVLCSAALPALRAKWTLSCSGNSPKLNLLGKVVVIGAESGADSVVVFGRRWSGYELQANYIDALLSGRYMRAPSDWPAILLFAAFLFGLEVPALVNLFIHELPLLLQVTLKLLWTGAFVAFVIVGYYLFGFFPPLYMLFAAVMGVTPFLIPEWIDVWRKRVRQTTAS